MTRDRLRSIIARTGCKLIARHNGRAFAVPAFANFNVPSAGSSPSCADGLGPTVNSPTVGPASFDLINLLHETENARV